MYNPAPWQVINGCSDSNNPDPVNPNSCWYGLSVPCDCTGRCSTCTVKKSAFFTNYTTIPGDPTLPEEMFDEWLPERRRKTPGKGFNPWNAPGSATVFGNGCGVNGGNPDGCKNGSKKNHFWTFQVISKLTIRWQVWNMLCQPSPTLGLWRICWW